MSSLAQLDYLVPEAYTQTLASLFEQNTPSEWAEVSSLIEADLGAPLTELFEYIDPRPVASASLAQVHIATQRHTGRRLAVKAQHPGLREACYSDLVAVGVAVSLANRFFGDDFCISWVMGVPFVFEPGTSRVEQLPNQAPCMVDPWRLPLSNHCAP